MEKLLGIGLGAMVLASTMGLPPGIDATEAANKGSAGRWQSVAQTGGAVRPATQVMPVPGRRPAPPLAKLDGKIGQMIMVGVLGTMPSDPGVKAVLAQLRRGEIGGVILMGRNITSPRQLRALTGAIRQAAKAGGHLPPLIAVDQEGGHVQRLKEKNGHESFPYSARTIATRCTPDQSYILYQRLACQLHSAGVNLNFGPVVDLDLKNGRNPIIGRLKRSYGKDAATVIEYANWFNAAHKNYGVLTAAKHFPGHGSSLTDSHKGFTDISRTWREAELTPYKSLAKENFADMVMTGHLYHPKFSDGRAPASLSRKAIRGVLRKQIGFEQVVITDDLQMKAVTDSYPLAERVTLAINAGNDIVLLSNTFKAYPALGRTVHRSIRKNVHESCAPNTASSCISKASIDAAYARIVKLKRGPLQVFYRKPVESCRKAPPVSTLFKNQCRKDRVGGGRQGFRQLRTARQR